MGENVREGRDFEKKSRRVDGKSSDKEDGERWNTIRCEEEKGMNQ